MEVRNCPRCGKMFTYMSSNICPDCVREEEEKFKELKTYIDENPHCTTEELCENTNTTLNRVLRYIKEGRLEISKGMHGTIKCENCGKPIVRGRFCDACVIQINQDVDAVFKGGELSKRKVPKMHTAARKL